MNRAASVRNLEAALSDVDTDTPHFDVAVEFDNIGVAAVDKFPGVRGFSALLRSDRSGGLIRDSVDRPGGTTFRRNYLTRSCSTS